MAEKKRVPRSELLARTLALLKSRPKPLTLPLIAHETGLAHEWLMTLAKEPEISPSVDRVVVLYEYLSGRKIKL